MNTLRKDAEQIYTHAIQCSLPDKTVKNCLADMKLSEKALNLLKIETPKELQDVTYYICGDVQQLCKATAEICKQLGYTPVVLTSDLCCEAREAGSFLASIARSHAEDQKQLAFIAGGETVVHLKGKGMGGRNQELVLSAAEGIAGLSNVAVFSVGSDGTDGPTDAAGGYVHGNTKEKTGPA